MRKLFITLCFVLACAINIAAQTTKVYGVISSTRKTLTGKVTISVNFGQMKVSDSSKVVDENDKPLTFESMLDAMNYMSQLGWNFESTYFYALGNGSILMTENTWIISKEIPTSEIIENISEPIPADGK